MRIAVRESGIMGADCRPYEYPSNSTALWHWVGPSIQPLLYRETGIMWDGCGSNNKNLQIILLWFSVGASILSPLCRETGIMGSLLKIFGSLRILDFGALHSFPIIPREASFWTSFAVGIIFPAVRETGTMGARLRIFWKAFSIKPSAPIITGDASIEWGPQFHPHYAERCAFLSKFPAGMRPGRWGCGARQFFVQEFVVGVISGDAGSFSVCVSGHDGGGGGELEIFWTPRYHNSMMLKRVIRRALIG